eukprot:GHVU01008202.1.p2 GENE.GHVU01008202.1~~GHVU01008202.1.p2  ORF type:complete len:152 (+),score=14.75 GHVU01008202.1:246-701(+)
MVASDRIPSAETLKQGGGPWRSRAGGGGWLVWGKSRTSTRKRTSYTYIHTLIKKELPRRNAPQPSLRVCRLITDRIDRERHPHTQLRMHAYMDGWMGILGDTHTLDHIGNRRTQGVDQLVPRHRAQPASRDASLAPLMGLEAASRNMERRE